jgi:hypothetical protein
VRKKKNCPLEQLPFTFDYAAFTLARTTLFLSYQQPPLSFSALYASISSFPTLQSTRRDFGGD